MQQICNITFHESDEVGPIERAKKCVDQKNRPLADKGDSTNRTHVAWEICLAPVQVQKHTVGVRGVPADLILQSARSAVIIADELTNQEDGEIGSVSITRRDDVTDGSRRTFHRQGS